MADLNAVYRQILKESFALKREKNPRYSLRGFARFLGVDATFLSKLMEEVGHPRFLQDSRVSWYYSTVTLFARFLGRSMFRPRVLANS